MQKYNPDVSAEVHCPVTPLAFPIPHRIWLIGRYHDDPLRTKVLKPMPTLSM